MRRIASAELNKLRERVDIWRKQQGKRTQIPEGLWEDAVGVAQIDGIWATSQATRFNYERLRERVAQARRRRPKGATSTALTVVGRGAVKAPGKAGQTFVELPTGAVGAAGHCGQTVVELEGRHGHRMRVHVGGHVDVAGLVEAFWSRQP